MNYLNKLKELIVSKFYVVLIAGLVVGCASVTDATPELQQGVDGAGVENAETDPIWYPTNRDEMDPIIDRPDDPQGG